MNNGHVRTLTTAMISMAFVVLGFAGLVVRGIAQQPPEQPTKAKRSIRTAALIKDGSELRTALDPTQGMFHRTPLDPSVVDANNRFGMAAVRVQELLNRPEIKSYLPILNGTLSEALGPVLKSNAPLTIRCENIEWIAARPNMTIRAKTKDKKGQLQFGAGGFSIKLIEPLDLTRWVEEFAPQSKRHVIEGHDVFEFTIHAMGPLSTYVWMPDTSTICVGSASPKQPISPQTKLSDLILDPLTSHAGQSSAPANEVARSQWSTTWARIDRGPLSAVVSNFDASGVLAELDDNPEFQSGMGLAAAPFVRGLLTRCKLFAFSCDFANGSSQFGIRVNMVHASSVEALQSQQDVRALLAMEKAEIENELEAPESTSPNTELSDLRLFFELLRVVVVEVNDYEDGTADVVISTAIPFGKLIEYLSTEAMAEEPSKTERR